MESDRQDRELSEGEDRKVRDMKAIEGERECLRGGEQNTNREKGENVCNMCGNWTWNAMREKSERRKMKRLERAKDKEMKSARSQKIYSNV